MENINGIGRIKQKTIDGVELVIRSVYPEIISKYGIREVTLTHPKILPRVLKYLEEQGKIEKISTRAGRLYWRWRNNK